MDLASGELFQVVNLVVGTSCGEDFVRSKLDCREGSGKTSFKSADDLTSRDLERCPIVLTGQLDSRPTNPTGSRVNQDVFSLLHSPFEEERLVSCHPVLGDPCGLHGGQVRRFMDDHLGGKGDVFGIGTLVGVSYYISTRVSIIELPSTVVHVPVTYRIQDERGRLTP